MLRHPVSRPLPEGRHTISDRNRLSDRRFTNLLQLTVAVLALVQSIFWQNTIDADGMSYIDVGYAYADRDWAGAVNAYWSPLFSWIVAAVVGVFDPSPAIEFPVIHAIDFFIFLLALFAFSFFVRQLFARFAGWREPGEPADDRPWLALTYAAFAYGSLVMQNIGRGGPDFLLCAAFYCAVGLVLRLANGSRRPTLLLIGIGGVLGLGYLAKAMMFPLAIIMLACVTVVLRRTTRRWLSVAPAVIAFAVVATPWIAVLSHAKGRLTYGDAGKLVYAWYVNEAPIRHADTSGAHGPLAHPVRELSTRPVIYEFAEPIRGTYPLWYDASYWHEGIRIKLNARQQLRRLKLTAEDFLNQSPGGAKEHERETWFYPVLTALIALALVAGVAAMKRAVESTWFVIIPVLSGFGLYAFVLLIARYVAPFFVVGLTTLVVGTTAAIRGASSEKRRASAMIATGLTTALTLLTLSQLYFVDRWLPLSPPYAEIAARLHSYGVPPASRVGLIGDSMHAYWAHLARFRIVAEIAPEETGLFWAQDGTRRFALLEAFRNSGAVAVVADHVPSSADTSGWVPAGSPGYWVYLLSTPASRTLP